MGRPVPAQGARELEGVDYAYLVYPHKPIVAYLPQTGQLLNEYCVEFPDETRPYGSPRLPDSDDVLAKWMALKGDERLLSSRPTCTCPAARSTPKRSSATCGAWASGSASASPAPPARPPSGRRAETADGTRASAAVDGPRQLLLMARPHSIPSTSRVSSPRARARAAARAYLHGIGFDDEALSKPIVGVASTWIETMPCNFGLRALAARVKEGIRAAGGTPMEFNTVAISDGITMGTSGMKTSLVSREVIADSIELVARGHLFDAIVALSACDKTIPGAVMALARLDVPGVMLYGGSILPGRYNGQDVTIQEVFEAVGAHAAGRIDDEELRALEDAASPGIGACGGQFTANTMAMAFEVLGISPMGAAMVPAAYAEKAEVARRGRAAGHGRPRPRPAPARHHHPRGARERHHGHRHERRLHQRRAAPAGGGPRGRRGAGHRRLRPHLRPHAAAVRPQAGRALRGRDLYDAGGIAVVAKRCSRPGCCTRTRRR